MKTPQKIQVIKKLDIRERAHSNDRVAKADLREEKRDPTTKSKQAGRASDITERINVQENTLFLPVLFSSFSGTTCPPNVRSKAPETEAEVAIAPSLPASVSLAFLFVGAAVSNLGVLHEKETGGNGLGGKQG
ncbi:hypothetical protein SLA2020_474290 [Shorea laevis]